MSTSGIESSSQSPPQYVNPLQLLLVPRKTPSHSSTSSDLDGTSLQIKSCPPSQVEASLSMDTVTSSPCLNLPHVLVTKKDSEAKKTVTVRDQAVESSPSSVSPAEQKPSSTEPEEIEEQSAPALSTDCEKDQHVQAANKDVLTTDLAKNIAKDVSLEGPPEPNEPATPTVLEDDIQIIFSAPVRKKPVKMVLARDPVTGLVSYGRISSLNPTARTTASQMSSSGRQTAHASTSGRTLALSPGKTDSDRKAEGSSTRDALSTPANQTLNIASAPSQIFNKARVLGQNVENYTSITNSRPLLQPSSSHYSQTQIPNNSLATQDTVLSNKENSAPICQQMIHPKVNEPQLGKRPFSAFQEKLASPENVPTNTDHASARPIHGEADPFTYAPQVSRRYHCPSSAHPSPQQHPRALTPQNRDQSSVSQHLQQHMRHRTPNETGMVTSGSRAQTGPGYNGPTTNLQPQAREARMPTQSVPMADKDSTLQSRHRSRMSETNARVTPPPVYKSLYDIPEWPGPSPEEQIQSQAAQVAFMSPHQQSESMAARPPSKNPSLQSHSPAWTLINPGTPFPPVVGPSTQFLIPRDAPSSKDQRKLILDIAKTCETVFPFHAVAQRHEVSVHEVSEVFSALFHLPAMQANDNITAQRLKDHEAKQREMELKAAQEAKKTQPSRSKQRRIQP